MKKDLRKLNESEIKSILGEMGEKPFRSAQILEWLWKKSVYSFNDMTNLSLHLRTKLNDYFEIPTFKQIISQKSADMTVKTAFQLHDGPWIEGVLIPTSDRLTACVSSQVGCSLTCKFCATGYMKRVRNLEAHEIYDQVVAIQKQGVENFGRPLTNIVFMGMGEPLLNYANVLKAIHYITSEEGLYLSSKRITVSTAGIAKMIEKLGDDDVKFNLALSLHAVNDEKRNKIMPINESNSLTALQKSLLYFYEKTQGKITLEYIIFNDFNDTLEDAKELYNFARKLPCKVNIIEYNSISEADFINTTSTKLDLFVRYLESKNIIVNVRRSRGKDIDAACGQLANKVFEKLEKAEVL